MSERGRAGSASASWRPAEALVRVVPVCLAVAAVGLAVAIATGVVSVPNLGEVYADADADSLRRCIYLVLAALVFLETSSFVGFVIHGELALLAGGVAAERGDASLPALIALVAASAVAGDLVSLYAGRRLSRPFLERHGSRIGLGGSRLARVDGFFARHGGKALFLGRFTGFLRATMPFVAGTSGVTARRLLPYSVASALVWTGAFTSIGYAFAESFTTAGDTATRVALVAILVIAAGLLLRARRARGRDDHAPGTV